MSGMSCRSTCALLKKTEENIYGTAQRFQDSDKNLFSHLRVNPPGEKSDRMPALGVERGDALSTPWSGSHTLRWTSDLPPCAATAAAAVLPSS